MKQNDIKKLPKAFLNAALTMQIIFQICTVIIVAAPEAVLRASVTDYKGGYTMPFDYIHFGVALITTVLFGVMYTLLMLNIKKGKQLGLGFGVILGVLAYLTYFLATSVTTQLITGWVDTISRNEALVATWSLGLEENIACYAVLVAIHGMAKFALKTAIILVLVAYGVYAMRNREQNTPKRLY